ncbi:transcription-repair coupling factor [Pirellulaceae bacterium SH501]
MKAKRPKSRTLSDFLKRGADASEPDDFHDDPNAIESIELTLEKHAQRESAASSKQKSGAKEAARKRSIPKSGVKIPQAEKASDSFDAERKRAERAAQIERSEKLDHDAKAVQLRAKAAELLDGVLDLKDFESTIKKWSRGEPICWEGAWLGAVAPITAAAWRKLQRPLVVVLSQHQDVEVVARDLDFFLEHSCDIFPPASDEIAEDALQQAEVVQRLHVLSHLQSYRKNAKQMDAPVIVTTAQALMHNVPSPSQLENDRRTLRVGQRVDLAKLKSWLAENGYRTTTSVQMAGEFTARGGILDVFPPDCNEPRRIEWFDDEIDSIRSFDPITQRSSTRLDQVDLIAADEAIKDEASFFEFLPKDAMVLVHEPIAAMHHAEAYLARIPFPERFRTPGEIFSNLSKFASAQITQLAIEGYTGELLPVPIGDVQRIGGEMENLAKQVDQALGKNRTAMIVCINEGELSRMHDLMQNSLAYQEGRALLELGLLSAGFELPPSGAFVLTLNQMLRRSTLRRSSKRHASRAIDSFLDLKPGDLVVHLSHGIGIYLGMEIIEKHGQKFEHLTIEFDGGTKLFVPTTKIDLVQRYVGGTKTRPKLAKIGGQAWVRQKKAAEESVVDMAAELLELQAQRRSISGIAFKPDSVWQTQFDTSFPYEETPDQLTAIAATKTDMMSSRPMERLLCGDVGFGKTEVAMRAAFKAVESGYQVAVLVPTTVLAEQHYKTFKARMAEFPFEIAKLNRFVTASQQRETLKRLTRGQIDIVVGTHRVASMDVKFYNLGLLIIDEEQKFGVELKERLKRSNQNVDVLSMSATPIPRTLHMSLVGVRDISNLETAPEERMAVETRVARFDEQLIRNAILRELNRDGQVYFVHNRIEDMPVLLSRLQRIVPEARILVGHGQMEEGALEQVMVDFIEHRADILLATTIIESGLDIPNANTMFIDEADRYGLSELHQLRGRVGRYKNQAYCYLLVDKSKHLSPDSARRLHAIEEFSQLGAGFGIAMRDLEIRGAGNLLGTQQSGHIAAVGYELYCQLLENAVRELTKQPQKIEINVELNVPIEAYLPSEYVPEMRHKIDIYRRLSRIQNIQSIDEIKQELEDRFGKLPKPVERLLAVSQLRMDATIWSIKYVGIEDEFLVFHYTDRSRAEQLAKKHNGRLRIVDQSSCYWPLRPEKVQTSVGTPTEPIWRRARLEPAMPGRANAAKIVPPEPIEKIIQKTDLLALLQSILQL